MLIFEAHMSLSTMLIFGQFFVTHSFHKLNKHLIRCQVNAVGSPVIEVDCHSPCSYKTSDYDK